VENKAGCTVIGDAVIDILIPVHSFDQFNTALVGGTLNAEYMISPGGTANVAVGLSTLGGKSAFIGKVGTDCFGAFFRKDLEEARVLSRVSVSKTRKTGLAIIISSTQDAERFFIVERGANVDLALTDLDYDLAHSSMIVYFTGFSFQDSNTSSVVLSFIDEASRAGKTIVFNPGAHNIAASSREAMINAVKDYADVVILNHAEGERLSQCPEDERIVEFLLSLGVSTVALTKGQKGSLIATRSRTYPFRTDLLEVVDSTGAGDAYAAGTIHGMLKRWKLERTGRFASLLAQTVVRQKGPRCDFRRVRLL
jgi:sugar/nucleoside kinase (ribokinase family)